MSWPGGLYGSGMHLFILMEAELGFRAAAAQDDEDCWGAEAELYFLTMREEEDHGHRAQTREDCG